MYVTKRAQCPLQAYGSSSEKTIRIEQLEPVSDDPGKVWDICKVCVTLEKAHEGKF